MYFSDPKGTLKSTIITKQGHKEVDSTQVNPPRKNKKYIRICQTYREIIRAEEIRLSPNQKKKNHCNESSLRTGSMFHALLFLVHGTSLLHGK